MSPARRSAARRGWPRGLYEPRPGYYVWRSSGGTTFAIGAVPLSVAKAEANAANVHEAGAQPTLVERLTGTAKTIGDVLDQMPPAKAVNTARSWRTLDKAIRDALGLTACYALTVAACAELVEGISKAGKARMAEAVRSRLVQVCKRGQQLGWLESNPAEITAVPAVKVKRGRLTLDTYRAIFERAPKVADWLQRAMLFGIVLGADRLTISQLQRSNVGDDLLTYRRQKTGNWVAVPLALRMDVVATSLADLVNWRGKVLSPYLLHHQATQGQASAGDPIHPDTITQAFTAARALAKIPDAGAPTFHELRSLCKRTYEAQGGVDTKALLGHAGERVAELYANPRGIEPVRVKVAAAQSAK